MKAYISVTLKCFFFTKNDGSANNQLKKINKTFGIYENVVHSYQ